MTDDAWKELYATPHAEPLPRYHAPQETFLQQYGKKLAGGLGCSFFVAFVMHLPYVKVVLVWACHIVILVFGKPESITKVEDKVKELAGKGKAVIKAEADPGQGDAEEEAPKKSRIKTFLHKQADAVKEEVAAPVKKVVEKGEEVKNAGVKKVDEGVQTVKDTGQKVVEAVTGKAKDAKEAIGTRVADFKEARAEAAEKAERERRKRPVECIWKAP